MIAHAEYETWLRTDAASIGRSYEVDADDLYQEMMVEFYSEANQRLIDAKDPTERVAYVRTMCRRAAMRYAKKEKAARCGFRPEDVFTYTRGVVEELIGPAFDSIYGLPVLRDASETGVSGGLANEGNNLLVMLADVRTGLERLPKAQYEMLVLRFVLDAPLAEIGEVFGTTEDAIRKRIDRAVWRLIGLLNKEPGVEPAERRHVVSNARAIVLAGENA